MGNIEREELAEQRAEVLPEREEMSLITGGTGGLASGLPGAEGMASDGGGDAGGATDTADGAAGPGSDAASGAAGDATQLGDAEGSGTTEQSVTDQDRSETFTSSDSASAGP